MKIYAFTQDLVKPFKSAKQNLSYPKYDSVSVLQVLNHAKTWPGLTFVRIPWSLREQKGHEKIESPPLYLETKPNKAMVVSLFWQLVFKYFKFYILANFESLWQILFLNGHILVEIIRSRRNDMVRHIMPHPPCRKSPNPHFISG